jgi:hypothetical protein
MCLPFAGTGLAAAGQVVGFAAQHQQAKAANKFQNRRYTETAQIALANYNRGLSLVGLQMQQAEATDSVTGIQNALAASAGKGSVAVGAAERGVDGNSIQALYDQYSVIEATNRNVLTTNRKWRERQAYEDMLSMQAQTISQISSVTPQPVAGPSPLALALSLGGTVMTGLHEYKTLSDPNYGKANATRNTQLPTTRPAY